MRSPPSTRVRRSSARRSRLVRARWSAIRYMGRAFVTRVASAPGLSRGAPARLLHDVKPVSASPSRSVMQVSRRSSSGLTPSVGGGSRRWSIRSTLGRHTDPDCHCTQPGGHAPVGRRIVTRCSPPVSADLTRVGYSGVVAGWKQQVGICLFAVIAGLWLWWSANTPAGVRRIRARVSRLWMLYVTDSFGGSAVKPTRSDREPASSNGESQEPVRRTQEPVRRTQEPVRRTSAPGGR
jgi:hypothetical protein